MRDAILIAGRVRNIVYPYSLCIWEIFKEIIELYIFSHPCSSCAWDIFREIIELHNLPQVFLSYIHHIEVWRPLNVLKGKWI